MNEGRLSALLELMEEQAGELKRIREDMAQTSSRLRGASEELESLRAVTGDLAELVKRNTRADWMTSVELAAELKVHEQTIRNWYEAGDIPGHRIAPGGHVRFDRQEVTEVIREKGL